MKPKRRYEVRPVQITNPYGLKWSVVEVMETGTTARALFYDEELAKHVCNLLNADDKKRGKHGAHTDQT